MKCRFCKNDLKIVFTDLGMSPFANSYINKKDVEKGEIFFPLKTFVCEKCFLVQLDEFKNPTEIFEDYAYFSSFSKTWVKHAKGYVEYITEKFQFNKNNLIVEIASNDGYLLQFFKKKGIPVLGIEPAANVAKVAIKKGIPTITKFFGSKTARELKNSGRKVNCIIANNVLPHTPHLLDFLKGIQILIDEKGVVIIQFSAYLLPLIKNGQFDHIYHEHFSYFSLFTITKILRRFNLEIFDVEEIPVHGGSLRIFIKKRNSKIPKTKNLQKFLKIEKEFGITKKQTYTVFQEKVLEKKLEIWKFFSSVKKMNKTIACYGAPAKGNTILNYCQIGNDFIDFTVDRNPTKQGKLLPGTHIPIFSPDKIFKMKPDYVVILPWNLKTEIVNEMKKIRRWGGKFVILTPKVKIF
ncbi:trans-aconitate 2-methyltransferase protein [Marine Group I thaumarchaeote SCGC AAA799-B03]|uniref:Trans-aconitate 2-methyltransferase protein n=1 Tax=Marine Group I thaumarchaeote SCGC AAA799-B03 TaxID=1502289 RepID=A0A087S8U6_9ARCH|nr:trans-aconitate 2-methyltransferase protein [Marine Group I thaumarchaeote SCGC AAA799-B03]